MLQARPPLGTRWEASFKASKLSKRKSARARLESAFGGLSKKLPLTTCQKACEDSPEGYEDSSEIRRLLIARRVS